MTNRHVNEPLEIPATSTSLRFRVLWCAVGVLVFLGRMLVQLLCAALVIASVVAIAALRGCGQS